MSELENKLAGAGVFRGAGGLEGILKADAFWNANEYGTRLYYGSGVGDYLHRDVLRVAVDILNKSPDQETTALQAEIGALSLFNKLGQKLVKRIQGAPAEGDNKDDIELRLMAIIAERDALKLYKGSMVELLATAKCPDDGKPEHKNMRPCRWCDEREFTLTGAAPGLVFY